MQPIYIYSGHSTIGSPTITELFESNKTPTIQQIEEYYYLEVPPNYQFITLYQPNQPTYINTTILLFRAIKQIENFGEVIRKLFDYQTQEQKISNIKKFDHILVSNFLINSLNLGQKNIENFTQRLSPIISKPLIDKIYQKYINYMDDNRLKNPWSGQNYISNLFTFGFISDEIVQDVLREVNIDVNIYKSGEKIRYMNFDDLAVFEQNLKLYVYISGIYQYQDYKNLESILWKRIDMIEIDKLKINNPTTYKILVSKDSRSKINQANNLPRFYNLETIFGKLPGGTYIIPSCGKINRIFSQTIVNNGYEKTFPLN